MVLNKVFKLMQLFMSCYDVGTEIVVAALIYTERILALNEGRLTMNEHNAKGFLHSALTLASKFFLDRYERNTVFHMLLGNPTPPLENCGSCPDKKPSLPSSARRRMRMMLDQYLDLI